MARGRTRIEGAFNALRERGEKGFIAYITAGDPSLRDTVDTVRRLADAGVDIIELGIPFSDPLADGRVNQDAATRALAAGATVPGVLDAVRAIRRDCDVPLLFFSYLNPLHARGFETAARESAAAGVDGFLVLDLPAEEAVSHRAILRRHGLNNIALVAPTSTDARIRQIVRGASGFVYCVSREGVTGARRRLAGGARRLVERTRSATTLPIALGFGISSEEQARSAARFADAVVVGSAIVDRLHRAPHNASGRARAASWVGRLVRAVKEV